MSGTNTNAWLRPFGLGYQIADAFYDRATDKREARREIIEVRDGAAFLAASGYDGGR